MALPAAAPSKFYQIHDKVAYDLLEGQDKIPGVPSDRRVRNRAEGSPTIPQPPAELIRADGGIPPHRLGRAAVKEHPGPDRQGQAFLKPVGSAAGPGRRSPHLPATILGSDSGRSGGRLSGVLSGTVSGTSTG